MTALLDRLVYVRNEDGEQVHRLQGEWDGNEGFRACLGDQKPDGSWWEAGWGVAWSCVGLGVQHEWSHDSLYAPHRVPARRDAVTLTVGPLYVSWMRVRPLRRRPS